MHDPHVLGKTEIQSRSTIFGIYASQTGKTFFKTLAISFKIGKTNARKTTITTAAAPAKREANQKKGHSQRKACNLRIVVSFLRPLLSFCCPTFKNEHSQFLSLVVLVGKLSANSIT